MLILIVDRILLTNLDFQLRNAKITRFWNRVTETEEKYNAEKGNIERVCKNLPVQGLCADMLKIAMASLFLLLEPRGVKLVNCVHDELVFECKAAETDEIGETIKTEMERAGSLFLKDLPCVVDVTIANFWKKE